jgi:hypothetical protein
MNVCQHHWKNRVNLQGQEQEVGYGFWEAEGSNRFKKEVKWEGGLGITDGHLI